MKGKRGIMYGLAALTIAAVIVTPASASTFIRMSLDDLVSANSSIIMGEVLDVYSHWNDDGTFILTEVRIAVTENLKGNTDKGELTITVMGGTIGDLTTLIVGGPELIPGRSYVMFINEEDLPSAKSVQTIRDHCQGVFNIEQDKAGGGLRAISQAIGHPLIPDKAAYTDPPGGVEGIPLEAMIESVRELAAKPHEADREVK